jgi:dienelactone hydrolase
LVVFAHGSGSSRHSPRNRDVASVLNQGALATLLFDLLTPEEDRIDEQTRQLCLDIELIGTRMTDTVDWIKSSKALRDLPIGLFGASTGAAATLVAAVQRQKQVNAVVSRGGRVDLANADLTQVKAPTMLLVGGNDKHMIEINRFALQRMRALHQLKIIPGAGHLFSEIGKLKQVANLALDWFSHHLCGHG